MPEFLLGVGTNYTCFRSSLHSTAKVTRRSCEERRPTSPKEALLGRGNG